MPLIRLCTVFVHGCKVGQDAPYTHTNTQYPWSKHPPGNVFESRGWWIQHAVSYIFLLWDRVCSKWIWQVQVFQFFILLLFNFLLLLLLFWCLLSLLFAVLPLVVLPVFGGVLPLWMPRNLNTLMQRRHCSPGALSIQFVNCYICETHTQNKNDHYTTLKDCRLSRGRGYSNNGC